MKCRGIQCVDFLLAKKLVGFQWRAGTTPSPGAAAKCCKAATSECMKSSPGYRWHPSFTVPKWWQKFIKHSVTSSTCKHFHVYIHSSWQLGSSSQLTMAFSRDAPWNVWPCYQGFMKQIFPRNSLQQELLSQAQAFFNCLKRRSWESNSLLIRSKYAFQEGWKMIQTSGCKDLVQLLYIINTGIYKNTKGIQRRLKTI